MFLFLAAALPGLVWEGGPDTADALRAAAISCISAPAQAVKAWTEANFCVREIRPQELEKLPAPGVRWGMRDVNTASATRAPWVDANCWRFLRYPERKYLYDLPRGAAPLAAAEAFAYGVDALLRIAPEDLSAFGNMLAFLKGLEEIPALMPAANIAVIDNGSPLLPEGLNLLARRNLLFRVVNAPDPRADLNVRIGSPEFPAAEAADPVAFADKVRRRLTDPKRLLRLYGSETALGRLLVGAGRARIHVLNYGGEPIEELRVRVRGSYEVRRIAVFGHADAKPKDYVNKNGATEFTIPEMGVYAVVDLSASR